RSRNGSGSRRNTLGCRRRNPLNHPPWFFDAALRSPSRKGRSRSLTVLLLILAVVWAVVLVPPWLRSRADARPADSITAFRHRLTVLERTGPVGTRRAPLLSHRPDVHGFVPVARRAAPRATPMSAMSSRARTQRRRR